MDIVFFLMFTSLLQICLPITLAILLLITPFKTKVDIALRSVAYFLFCLFLSYSGYWLAVSLWVGRFLPVFAFGVCTFKFAVSRKLPWFRNYGGSKIFKLFQISGFILVFLILILRYFLATVPSKNAVTLELPFQQGKYVVTDGGDGFISFFANYHFYALSLNDPDIHPALRFAADIERVGDGGRSVDFLPGQWLNEYQTWNAMVTSPCDGFIIDLEDNEDENIPVLDTHNFGMGNFLVIRMDSGHCVFLLHLKRGSLLVKKGTRVRVGESLARVGNSGKSRWPHLHIHVILPVDGEDYWWGEAVPFKFGNSWVVKNRMYEAGIKP